jgi:hypothetical protein
MRCSKRGKGNECTFLSGERARGRTATSQDEPPNPFPEALEASILSPISTRGSVSQASVEGSYPEITQSRLLYSSKGEKVFVGESASLSFLQFLRVLVRHTMGPCDFTETDFRDCMLEVDAPTGAEGDLDHPSLEQQEALVQVYIQATSGFLDLYGSNDLQAMTRELQVEPSIAESTSKSYKDRHAILCAILAIGAQARGDPVCDIPYARHYFKLAQTRAFEGMLCDPSLSMVRLFLLMAFYMFGACHRNAGFMYIGVAAKAACALGLHKEESGLSLAAEESDDRYGFFRRFARDNWLIICRLRCWRSLLVLDSTVNLVLGRPNCLPTSGFSSVCGEAFATANTSEVACSAILNLHYLVEGLDLKSRRGKASDVDEAVNLLKRTRSWSEALPITLQPGRPSHTIHAGPQPDAIAQLHVACAYYFTIILITRPFMISTFTKRSQGNGADNGESTAKQATDSKVTDLAQVCLDSSVYLAKASHAALTSGAMLANMCILKAWIFAAGLLIGFALFGHTDGCNDLFDAYSKTLAVLAHLRISSPQAALYHDILRSLGDAINHRKDQLLAHRRSMTNQYIQPLFAFGGQGSTGADGEAAEGAMPDIAHGSNVDPSLRPVSAFDTPLMGDAFGIDGAMDVANMSLLWDDIDFDWASLDFTFPV